MTKPTRVVRRPRCNGMERHAEKASRVSATRSGCRHAHGATSCRVAAVGSRASAHAQMRHALTTLPAGRSLCTGSCTGACCDRAFHRSPYGVFLLSAHSVPAEIQDVYGASSVTDGVVWCSLPINIAMWRGGAGRWICVRLPKTLVGIAEGSIGYNDR